MIASVSKKSPLTKAISICLAIVCFIQFTALANIAYAIKTDTYNSILKNQLLQKPPSITPERQSALAKKIVSGTIQHPRAIPEFVRCIESIEELLDKIEKKSSESTDIKIEKSILQAKLASLKDLIKKVQDNLTVEIKDLENKITAGGLSSLSATLNNVKKIKGGYQEKAETFLNFFNKQKIAAQFDLSNIRTLRGELAALKVFKEQKSPLKPSPLPRRPSDYKPIPPETGGTVTPAYIRQREGLTVKKTQSRGSQRIEITAAIPGPVPADLQETVDVVITQAMRDLVASLNNSPARIYEWVKNNIDVEFYYGSLKGSVGTFLEKAGNDVDTCSLLLALYRAANIPCRYVTGTIEIPVAQAKSLTGIENPDKIGTLFASAGIPVTVIVSGSTIVLFRIEHTWAEAFVDYDPYAGAKAGTGDTWVPLSPWYKFYTTQNGIDLLSITGFNPYTFIDDFIFNVKKESPVEAYKKFFDSWFKTNDPGKNWQNGLRTKELLKERLRTLPNTENFYVRSYNGEYVAPPDAMRHKVTITVPDVSLSYTVNMCEIVSKKVTFSYPPADQASKDLINNNGGIENVHPLSVILRPSLKIEGQVVATGAIVNAGYYHTLRTSFTVPRQASDYVDYWVIAGSHYAVGLDPQFVSSKYLAERIDKYISKVGTSPETTDTSDSITGEALYLGVMRYFNSCNTGDSAFARTLKVELIKQTSGAITGKGLVVWVDGWGDPVDLEPGGFFIDAQRNILTPISVTGDVNRQKDFFLLSGYDSSFNEHDLFQDFFHLGAISTVKLLSIAHELGMPVYDITSSNISSILPLLTVDNSVKSAIQSAVAAGHVVRIHRDNITFLSWNGCGYVDRDPATNAAGFIIWGGLAGGQTGDSVPSDPNPEPGKQPGNETVGDPVNPATGNLLTTEEDFTVPSRGMPLSFIRYNSSQSDYLGPFGYGWTHTHDEKVIENPDGSLTYIEGNGTRHLYNKNPDGTYKRPSGVYDTITKTAPGFKLREKNGIEHNFDTAGKLISIVDRNGNTISCSYTGNNLTQITDSASRTYSLAYNANNRIISVTINVPAPGPYTWTYTYNGTDLVSVTGPDGYPRTYNYYANHNLATLTNQKGGTYAYDYYSNDRVHTNLLPNTGSYLYSYNFPLRISTSTDPENNTTTYYYDGDGAVTGMMDPHGFEDLYELDSNKNKITTTDKNGGIIKNTYDTMGNMLTTTNQLDFTATFAYEPNFNHMTSATNALGKTTAFAYDPNGNLNTTTDALTHQTNFTYGANGDLLTTINAKNVTTSFTYNSYGYLSQKKNTLGPDNIITSITYDAVGNRLSVTDPEGHTTTNTYQKFNQLKEVKVAHEGINYTTAYEYDENGQRKAVIDAKGNRTEFNYNSYRQLVSTKDALNNLTSFTYDLNGNATIVTDAKNNLTKNYYDKLGRKIAVEDAMGNITSYEYDPVGNNTAIIDANGNKTQFQYSSLNQLAKATYPDGSNEIYTYDSVGNMKTKTNRKGDQIQYAYDDLNRLDLKTYPDTTTVDYNYDEIGRLLSITDNDSNINYQYDELDRMIKSSQNGKAVEYTYNKNGNRTKLIYPDADYITYEYDDLNRLDKIKDAGSNVIADFTYDELNRRTTLNLFNGTQAVYDYDAVSRLQNLTKKVVATGSIISSFAYTYDKVGNRKTMNTPEGVHNFTYDAIYQLTNVTYPDSTTKQYNFDKLGNRASVIDNGLTTNYSTNDLNQYTDVNNVSYAYDKSGNLTSDGINNYTYDFENRLLTANSAAYQYDAHGRRLSKTVGGTKTNYLYDDVHILCEYDNSGLIIKKYIQGPGIDQPICMISSGQKYYYNFDGLGSVDSITASTGIKVEQYKYNPYGKPTILDPATGIFRANSFIGNHFLYTGREFDDETGLYYYRARYYAPTIGRFLQVDPIEYQGGSNLYRYVGNNPVNWIDPRGLAVGDWWDIPANIDRSGQIANEELAKRPNSHNDMGDAMRHAEWMRRTTEETNAFIAWLAGTGHEIEGTLRGQPLNEMLMDLHNNFVGRDAGRNNFSVDPNNLWTLPLNSSQYNPYSSRPCGK